MAHITHVELVLVLFTDVASEVHPCGVGLVANVAL